MLVWVKKWGKQREEEKKLSKRCDANFSNIIMSCNVSVQFIKEKTIFFRFLILSNDCTKYNQRYKQLWACVLCNVLILIGFGIWTY